MSAPAMGSVLIAEGERTVAETLNAYLRRNGYLTRVCHAVADLARELELFDPDIVLLDSGLADMDGLSLLERVTARGRRAKVIVATGADNRQLAEEALKAGAHACLSRPLALGELKIMLDQALRHARLESAFEYYQSRKAAYSGLARLVGRSPAMLKLKDRIRQLIAAERAIHRGLPPAVLVTGEAGTGKELVARAFHFEGTRRHAPFIEANLATLSGRQLEGELFGFEPGAFLDSTQRNAGVIEAGHGGTLFLDEIAAMDMPVQERLLTLLESNKTRPLGGSRERAVDVRVIAATALDVDELVAHDALRADLVSRLRIIHLHLPPLRERGEDVLLLARGFLASHGRRHGRQGLELTSAARQALRRHHWPGNVRELGNVMEQSVLLAKEARIDLHHLMLDHASMATDTSPLDSGLDPRCEFNLERMEKNMLSTALQHTNGNISGAARLLGLSRDTLRYRMSKYQLRSNQ